MWAPVCPPLSQGHLPVEFFFGTLVNLPILLAAAFLPVALAGAAPGGRRLLTGAVAVLGFYFLVAAGTICAYAGATSRYLVDFIPALTLLAWLGFIGLVGRPGAAAQLWPAGHKVVRAAVALAFTYSVVTGWLLALALSAFYRGAERGSALIGSGRISEAIESYDGVCRIDPDFRGQAELAVGTALLGAGKAEEALGYLQSAVRDGPGVATAHFNLGNACLKMGRFREAADALGRAAELDPSDYDAEADLGVALARLGRLEEAAIHLRAALRINPDLEQVKGNLRSVEAVLKLRHK